jgi:hypothetical protein
VPEELERAIMTALAKAPEDRFPSAEAFGAALMPFASALGIAGPFSLHPSARAFEIASSTMSRVPRTTRASDASDLLKLPPSRTMQRATRPRWHSKALRTFVAALAIGIGLAMAVAMMGRASARRAHAQGLHPAPQSAPQPETLAALPPPNATGVGGADIVHTSGTHSAAPRETLESRPRSTAGPQSPSTAPSAPSRDRTETPHAAVVRPLYL